MQINFLVGQLQKMQIQPSSAESSLSCLGLLLFSATTSALEPSLSTSLDQNISQESQMAVELSSLSVTYILNFKLLSFPLTVQRLLISSLTCQEG